MRPDARPWYGFAVATAFTLYWLSNAMLWYPWSVSETLGMVIMLTVSPVVWASGIAVTLARWPRPGLWSGAARTALIMLTIAVTSDLVFFGIVRDALPDLMHPSTYAAYGWVALLPFLVVAVRRRRLALRRTAVSAHGTAIAAGIGLGALGATLVMVSVTS